MLETALSGPIRRLSAFFRIEKHSLNLVQLFVLAKEP